MIPDLLRRAADVIDTSGWCQRTDVDPTTGGVCANGAIRVAAGHSTYTGPLGATRLGAPLDWTADQAVSSGRKINAAHNVLSEYMHSVHDFGPDGPTFSNILPAIVYYNDRVATSGGEVAAIMRAAAEWVESHPLQETAAVEKAAARTPVYPSTSVLAGAGV